MTFFRFIVLLILIGGSGCAGLPLPQRLPETEGFSQVPVDPVHTQEIESLLEGRFQSSQICPGDRRLSFQNGRIEMVELIPMSGACDGKWRGQVTYRGLINIGEMTVEDATSRPLTIQVLDIEAQALSPRWGMAANTKLGNCSLAQMTVGEVRKVMGDDCGAWGRFPKRDEIISSRLVLNSGQRIQISVGSLGFPAATTAVVAPGRYPSALKLQADKLRGESEPQAAKSGQSKLVEFERITL